MVGRNQPLIRTMRSAETEILHSICSQVVTKGPRDCNGKTVCTQDLTVCALREREPPWAQRWNSVGAFKAEIGDHVSCTESTLMQMSPSHPQLKLRDSVVEWKKVWIVHGFH